MVTKHGLVAIAALIMVLTISVTIALQAWPKWEPDLTAQICVERPENNGVLNIRPSEVMVQGGPVLILSGGQAACAMVEGGATYTVWVQSRDPYDPSVNDPSAWRSADLKVEVNRHGRVELVVCGEVKDAAYANWGVHAAGWRCK